MKVGLRNSEEIFSHVAISQRIGGKSNLLATWPKKNLPNLLHPPGPTKNSKRARTCHDSFEFLLFFSPHRKTLRNNAYFFFGSVILVLDHRGVLEPLTAVRTNSAAVVVRSLQEPMSGVEIRQGTENVQRCNIATMIYTYERELNFFPVESSPCISINNLIRTFGEFQKKENQPLCRFFLSFGL